MRAVVQRVSSASVTVENRCQRTIGTGLLIYLGIAPDDRAEDVSYIADKIRHLRIFPDSEGRLNLDIKQINGHVLVVSAFTVQADARKGRRPSFDAAAPRTLAVTLYEQVCDALAESGVEVQRGSYGEHMVVQSNNDGPICILLDSRRAF